MVSAHHLKIRNMCTNFIKNTFDSLSVMERKRFLYKSGYNCLFKITKGHSSVTNVGADMFFFVLCTPFDDGLYLKRNL